MKKDEILQLVKEIFKCETKKDAEEYLGSIDTLVETIAEKLEIKGKTKIGKYIEVEKKHVEAKHTDARIGRNPSNGAEIQIPAKDTVAHDEIKIKGTKALNK